MSEIMIRKARAADTPRLVELVAELADFHGDIAQISAEDMIYMCFGPAPWVSILVAEQGGCVIGYAALGRHVQMQFARRLMDVHHLYVVQAHRGAGAGRALLNAARAQAKEGRCAALTVGVMAENAPAIRFYEKFGFMERQRSGALGLSLDLGLHSPRSAP